MQPQVKQTYKNLKDFVAKTRKLLTQELQAQKQDFQRLTSSKTAAQIQQQGAGLSNMVVLTTKQGFYDRIVLTLAKNYYSQKNRLQIPQHCKLQVGDDVAIYSGDIMIAEGIIYRRTNQKIKITVNLDPEKEDNDFEDMKVNIVLKWNQVTYRRYFFILDKLQNPHIDLDLEYLFFKQTATDYRPKQPQKFICQKMNQKQNAAIANGLTQLCHLIHGPPGTGKTTTVCQLIVQAVNRGEKVLACAPSNIAVDNIVEGISHRVNCVRVGNPARIINDVIQRCLDFLISRCENQWKNQQKKLNAAQKKLKRTKVKAQRKQIYGQIKQIRTQIKNLQQQIIQQILSDANVICCTNVGADDKVFRKYLSKRKFDLVVIDQCGQGLQISCWIPISRGKRLVLAGDHKQLPPTVKFQQQSLLSYTLFSRCMQQLPYLTSTMLQVQYRMNKSIMGWSNKQFYENKLIADKSVENHVLKQIYNNLGEENGVLMFVDTAGCQVGEQGGQMESKMNIGQADIVTHIYNKLIAYGVQPKDIAILTPYSKQVTLIKSTIAEQKSPPPQVSTVDGIQGRQKQCIIISLVRSNPERQIGFLKDWRRMNVAVTRARRMLVIVGDSDCVTVDEKIRTLYNWVEENGVVSSAEEMKGQPMIRFGLGKIVEPGDMIKLKEGNTQNNKQKAQKKKQKPHKAKPQKPTQHGQQTSINPDKPANQPTKTHSIAQQESLKQTYKALLQNLKQPLAFHDLNAYERKMMHEVAEQFGYIHETSEDKSKITVTPLDKEAEKLKKEEEEAKRKKKEKRLRQKERQREKKEQAPKNLKQLIGDQSSGQQPEKQQPQKQQQVEKQQVKIQQKKKPKKNKKQKQQQQQQNIPQNWQQILDQFTAELPKSDQCYKCKKKITSVTAAQCKFCSYHFCRHDLLAEEHGCEEAARQHARKPNLDRYLQEGARKIQEKLKQQQDLRKKKTGKDKDKDKKK